MSISQEKVTEIMDGVENKIRHAYNCGYNDGLHAMKKKYVEEVADKVDTLLSVYEDELTE